MTFYKNESHLSGSLLERQHTTTSVTVPAVSIASFIEKFDIKTIDVLKVDIEGGEFALLSDLLPETLSYIRTILCEVHEDLAKEDVNFLIVKLQAGGFFVQSNIIRKGRYLVYANRL